VVYEPIRIRCGKHLSKEVEQFVFNNLIKLDIKVDPIGKNEFMHIYFEGTTNSTWETIGILKIKICNITVKHNITLLYS
jgi:hypothetical protein